MPMLSARLSQERVKDLTWGEKESLVGGITFFEPVREPTSKPRHGFTPHTLGKRLEALT